MDRVLQYQNQFDMKNAPDVWFMVKSIKLLNSRRQSLAKYLKI